MARPGRLQTFCNRQPLMRVWRNRGLDTKTKDYWNRLRSGQRQRKTANFPAQSGIDTNFVMGELVVALIKKIGLLSGRPECAACCETLRHGCHCKCKSRQYCKCVEFHANTKLRYLGPYEGTGRWWFVQPSAGIEKCERLY